MTESPRIDGLLRRIRGEVRRRRAEYYGVRGAFWGAVGGVAVLLSKHGIGSAAPWIAGALLVVGACAGIAYGLAPRVVPAGVGRRAPPGFRVRERGAPPPRGGR